MFFNNLKITLRNVRRHKGYTFINVIGLAISIACCMLIGLWILSEQSYDKHYDDVDRITAILMNGHFVSPNALASHLAENIPEIEYAARITHGDEALVNGESVNSFEEVLAADASFLNIISFPFSIGDPRTALSAPGSVVLTSEVAQKYFPDENPLGKTLTLNNDREFTVTGVIEDLPQNSSFQFDLLASIDYQRQFFIDRGFDYDAWGFRSTRTLAKVQPGVAPMALSEKITGSVREHFEDQEVQFAAINIGDVYLRFSETRETIKVFSAIVLAILLMACINFVNLSTARYRMRAKETAMRKIIGANRTSLILQFLGESVFLMLVGVVGAVGLVELALPLFNSLFELNLSLALFDNAQVIAAGAAIFTLTALATGIYPAIVLSRFTPIKTLRSHVGSTGKRFNLRRVLVVIQFGLTAVLIIGTAIIYRQVTHMKTWDVGYDKEHVVNIRLRGESQGQFDVLKAELSKNASVISVTGGSASLPYWHMFTTASWDGLGPDEERDVGFNFVKLDFTETFGIAMADGRDFDPDHTTDLREGCVINETLARMMDQPNPLGSRINVWEEDRTIIGVMKDFNFRPLDNPIEPLALVLAPPGDNFFASVQQLSVRIDPRDISGTLGFIEETWNAVVSGHPFEYSFLDQQFDDNYRSLTQTGDLALCFGLLAIFIAALGLFGLASFTAEQRTKEIGIRKVLGASVVNIVRMLSREYVVLVVLANLIAWPVAWYLMRDWLAEFAYHIDMELAIFFAVGAFSLLVALLSVGYQAVRAASANPVDAIEYE